MTIADNKALVRELFERAWNGQELRLVDERFAPDFAFYPPGATEATDREGFKRFLSMFQIAFPDGRWTLEDVVAEADRVALRIGFRGTHRAELQGIAPTGRTVAVTGYAIFRIADGRVQEMRGLNDRLGILQQLGALPLTPPTARRRRRAPGRAPRRGRPR